MIILLVFTLGLIIGSFLNVCIYRIPINNSVVLPRSFCPECKHPIPWHDNIPVLSFLFLRGKCRFCKKKISFRYITVELLTGALLTATYVHFGLKIDFFIYSFLFCSLIILTFIDFEFLIIPDLVTYPVILSGILVSALYPALHAQQTWYLGLVYSLTGAVIGGLLIYGLSKLGKIIFRKKLKEIGEDEAMGFGDVVLMALLGAFLGPVNIIMVFFIAPFIGSISGLIMKIKYKKDIMPYGPYLSMAAVIVVFAGEYILRYIYTIY